ncbi:MAG: hypothetical protein V1494_05270 [Candidatus Diapherotrites archaeon]
MPKSGRPWNVPEFISHPLRSVGRWRVHRQVIKGLEATGRKRKYFKKAMPVMGRIEKGEAEATRLLKHLEKTTGKETLSLLGDARTHLKKLIAAYDEIIGLNEKELSDKKTPEKGKPHIKQDMLLWTQYRQTRKHNPLAIEEKIRQSN